MARLSRYLVVLVASLAVVLVGQASIYAEMQDCWGARPLSMGGAFVAVSDDVHGVYWNQAALSRVKSVELTYTPTIHDRDLLNYDDFLGAAFPLGEEGQYGTLGLAYVYNSYTGGVPWRDDYIQVGYGIEVVDGLSLGLAVKHLDKEIGGTRDDLTGVDLSLLWEINDMFSVGVLYQNADEPSFLFGTYVANLRPGIAFKPFRDDTLVLALDMYDALDEISTELRFGVEWWVKENVALRAGAYDFTADTGSAITAGIGYVLGNLELDYAIMYWDSDNASHMIGVTYKF